MSKYQRCDKSVQELATELLFEFATHQPLIDARVKVDFVFAFAEVGEDGEPTGPALKLHGAPCLGICRRLGLKDRAKGMGDAEICLDGQWWAKASHEERRALLDHELHHLEVRMKDGKVMTDDLLRPKLALRKHDFQFGWFSKIAERHGDYAQERFQAQWIMDTAGQFYWPGLAGKQAKTKGVKV